MDNEIINPARFVPLRKAAQALARERVDEILARAEHGVLSAVSPNGYPYGVPLNFARVQDCLYFHSARAGHKLESIAREPRVSFCVIGEAKVLPEKFDTEFESVIVFGRAAEVADELEKERALVALIAKYSHEHYDKGMQYIQHAKQAVIVIKLAMEHVTGKRSS